MLIVPEDVENILARGVGDEMNQHFTIVFLAEEDFNRVIIWTCRGCVEFSMSGILCCYSDINRLAMVDFCIGRQAVAVSDALRRIGLLENGGSKWRSRNVLLHVADRDVEIVWLGGDVCNVVRSAACIDYGHFG